MYSIIAFEQIKSARRAKTCPPQASCPRASIVRFLRLPVYAILDVIRKREGTRDMKKNMAHHISDPADLSGRGAAASAAAARLSRAVRYRPVSRPAARVPLPEAGRLCPVFPSDGIRLRQAAGAHPQAPAPLAAGGGLCADRHGAGLPAQQRAAHALPAGQRLGTRAAYV